MPLETLKFTSPQDLTNLLKTIDLTDGLSLSQVVKITGIDAFSIQNWIKRGYAPRPVKKKYYERHLARLLLIQALKDAMKLEEVGDLMRAINGDTNDESDDIISETLLYGYFLKVIEDPKFEQLKDEELDKHLSSILKTATSKEKLTLALKVMAYAYKVLNNQRKVEYYFDALKNKEE